MVFLSSVQIQVSDLYHVLYLERIHFNTYREAGIPATKSLDFYLSEKNLTLLLEDNFPGYRILGWQIFSFNTLNISLQGSAQACPPCSRHLNREDQNTGRTVWRGPRHRGPLRWESASDTAEKGKGINTAISTLLPLDGLLLVLPLGESSCRPVGKSALSLTPYRLALGYRARWGGVASGSVTKDGEKGDTQTYCLSFQFTVQTVGGSGPALHF